MSGRDTLRKARRPVAARRYGWHDGRRMDASEDLLATGAFVECVFSCPSCGLAGTSLVRPANLIGKTCLGCGEEVVLSVLDRFRPSGGR
jgi:hypothetical protein